jgi:hypothetical protein
MKNQAQASIELTKLMNGKEKFAFLNISKSSIVSLSKKNPDGTPSKFNKEVVRSINLSDKRIIKSIPESLVEEVLAAKHSGIGLVDDGKFYSPNLFEYYYENNKEIYNTIFDFYIKNTKNVVVSFHDKKTIYKFMGFKTNVINVPFNNYVSRLEDTFEKIAALDGKIEYCILDCSSLGLALSNSIWNKLNMSIIDLGKTISYSKTYNSAE